MNSYDAPEQVPTGCPGCDLIEAVDLIAEVATLQRFLTIAHTLRQETAVEIDPDVGLLLYAYWESDVPAKLQAASDLIESVRKALT